MFAVVWANAALDKLADSLVQVDLPTQHLVEQKVLALNARLARDQLDECESRFGDFRLTFDLPISDLFQVDTVG